MKAQRPPEAVAVNANSLLTRGTWAVVKRATRTNSTRTNWLVQCREGLSLAGAPVRQCKGKSETGGLAFWHILAMFGPREFIGSQVGTEVKHTKKEEHGTTAQPRNVRTACCKHSLSPYSFRWCQI